MLRLCSDEALPANSVSAPAGILVTMDANSAFTTYLRCFRGCDAAQPHDVHEVIYRCPACNGLLEVHHELAPLRSAHSGTAWKRLLDRRNGTTRFPYGSGVWRYREWVMPQVHEDNIVSMYEGNTNLFHATLLGHKLGLEDLWIKMCGNSHTGSFKDLGMTVLISVVKQIMAAGTNRIEAVACASTGDTSAALAAYAAAAGIPAIIFLPRGKTSRAQLIQPLSNGAHVMALDTDFDGCMEIVRAVTQDRKLYLANSMNSLRIEGQKTVGLEIVQQFDWEVPDWIIVPSGNLGNVSAIYKGLQLLQNLDIIDRMPRLVAAQAENANPLYQSYRQNFTRAMPVTARPTAASAIQIGNPVSYEKAVQAIQASQGMVVSVTEHQLANAAALSDLSGLYACPHTGVALGALIQLAERGEIQRHDRVIVISTAHGLKFTQFKLDYHANDLDAVESSLSNPPMELPADLSTVHEAVAQVLAQHDDGPHRASVTSRPSG